MPDPSAGNWLQRRAVLIALALASLIPMLAAAVPPLTDLPGHMGRYRVQLDLATSPTLRAFYDFDWALIGNLGVDLLVIPLAPLLGLERAVWLIVAAIPVLTAAGFLLVARAAHGRVPPTALFALPLAYGYPLHFGFVNFALSAGLAFLALALWLHLGARERWRLRAALFVPIGLLLWVAHVYGWALLALLAAATELVAQHRRGGGWIRSTGRAALQGLALAPPLLLMLAWRSETGGQSFDAFDWSRKADWVVMALRDRWQTWDTAAVALLAAVVLIVPFVQRIAKRSGSGFDPGLGLAAIGLAAAFVLLPGTVFGSAYADMRLVPYALAVALLAIRPDAWGRRGGAVALAGLAFFAARTAGTTVSFARHDAAWRTQLAAMDHVPAGARLVTLVPKGCPPGWGTPRFDHLPSMALVRRRAFANDQWVMAGAQLLTVRARGWFTRDPSQFVVPVTCVTPYRLTIDQALARIPRGHFDHVWLVDPPAYDPRLVRGLRPVWRSGTSILSEVERLTPPTTPPPATPPPATAPARPDAAPARTPPRTAR